MLTNFINIDSFKYYIEYDDSKSFSDTHKANYVMLRNFTLMNNVVCDRDLYFIESDLYKKLKHQVLNKEQINCIVFPGHKNHNTTYSNHYLQFSDILIDDDFLNDSIAYKIYEKTNNDELTEKYVEQHSIKIYHPSIKTNNNYIIHVANVINNINVHYICNLYSNFNINSTTEIRKQNNIYSEYIEVLIPNIKDLFGLQYDFDNNKVYYSTFYEEDLNSVGFDSQLYDENSEEFKENIYQIDSEENQYIALALLTYPFLLKKDKEDNYRKVYFKHNLTVSNNFMLAPITVTMFPYDAIDNINKLYILSQSLSIGTCTLYYDYKFKLSSICDFDSNGNISLLTRFIYPNKEQFDKLYGPYESLSKAYCYFNGITDVDYYNSSYEKLYNTYKEELDEINHFTSIPENDKSVMIFNNAQCLKMNDTQLLAEYKRMKMESFLEEYIDTYKTDIDFFGFRIEIGTDTNFKNIIFTQNQSLSINFLKTHDIKDDITWDKCLDIHVFAFNIHNLLESWTQVTDTLIAKVYFIDRFIGFVIESNPIIITKEKFKYIVNKGQHNRLKNLKDYNDNMKEYVLEKNKDNTFNFINNISCIVHNDTEKNEKIIANIKYALSDNTYETAEDKLNAIKLYVEDSNASASNVIQYNQPSRIIYQPIFYAIQKADNIIINSNILQKQNIGVDLQEYMASVKTFILLLDNNKYIEHARNANFIIFEISAKDIINTSGTYDIYTQDNEYITSGNWIKK